MKYEKFHDWIFTSTDQLKEDRFYDDFKCFIAVNNQLLVTTRLATQVLISVWVDEECSMNCYKNLIE